jgi:predicted transcriptional regulator
MAELTVSVDDETARRVQDFADSINISVDHAAARLLKIAALVREVMNSKGLLAGGDAGEFVVSFERIPDGIRKLHFRRLTERD